MLATFVYCFLYSNVANTFGQGVTKHLVLQSTLGFATMDLAANLDLVTAGAVMDLFNYINSNLVFRDLKFCLLCSK